MLRFVIKGAFKSHHQKCKMIFEDLGYCFDFVFLKQLLNNLKFKVLLSTLLTS